MLGRSGRWLAGALAGACVVLLGPSAPSGAVHGRPLPAGAVGHVVPNRVMTWNLCNPCGEGNAERAAQIATYAPQVVALQEACTADVAKIRDYLEGLYGLAYHVEYGPVLRNRSRCGGLPWRPGGYGQAVLSATPLTDPVTVEYPDGGSEDRGYLAVTTTVAGRSVRVFNTHLAQRRQEDVRAAQTRVLAAAVARHDRAVVLGDFNAVPDAPELAVVRSVTADSEPGCASAGACVPTTDWQLTFDYVFLRGPVPLRHRVVPTPYSDHHLVFADLGAG
ncbi:endonuclease/exonuclease/phosphatase family protein [Streptomyces sp. NPDC101118]|uniref:endonuclease/exonuclease/phosphatase family protein n=1 Tax=Streptomyces sp. NPDC101118 TaxID=3366109 RepID=UPI0037F65BF3